MLPTTAPDTTTRATETQVLQALTSLAVLPSRQADDADMHRRMYLVALEGVTRYALSEAVKAIMRGALGHAFFPSPPELRRLCNEAQRPHNDEARRIRLTEDERRDRREFEAARNRAQSPAAKARVAAAYARFCEGYERAPSFVPTLDPELVAKLPDAPPHPFKSARVG